MASRAHRHHCRPSTNCYKLSDQIYPQNYSDVALTVACDIELRLSRFKLAGPPTPRDTEVSNAYAIMHDSLGSVCICSLIGINLVASPWSALPSCHPPRRIDCVCLLEAHTPVL